MNSILSAIIAAILSLFGIHHIAFTPPPSLALAPSAQTAAAANPFTSPATSSLESTTTSATPVESTTNATSDQTTPSQNVGPAPTEPTTSNSSETDKTTLLSEPSAQFNAADFVTQSELAASLLSLSNSLAAQFSATTSPPLPQYVAANGNPDIPYAAENQIGNLSGVTITNANLTASEIPALDYLSLSGGTLTGALSVPSLSASSTNYGVITGTDSSTTNATSTNLFATLGNITTGIINSLSGTTLTYTAASTSNFSNFGTAYFGGTATTTIDSAGDLAVAGNTTLQNATSTDFFASVASSTNLFAQSASLGALSAGTLNLSGLGNFANGFLSQASSTIAGPLTLTGTLSAQGATFQGTTTFQGAAFSGTPVFNSGFLSLASTTIGNGTAGGGLTINGGATTTGNIVGQGNLLLDNGGILQFYGNSPQITFSSQYDNGNPGFLAYDPATLNMILNAGRNNFTGMLFQTNVSGAAQTRIAILNGGNVGIGTTSPQTLLGLQGGIGVNSSQLYLAANGDVGIGTNNPSYALDISNNDTGSDQIRLQGSNSGVISTGNLYLEASNGGTVNLRTVGNTAGLEVAGSEVGVYTLAAGTSNSLCYNTSAISGFNTLSTCSSDERLKQNITSLDGSTSLAQLMELNPVSFNWNPEFASSSPLQFGLIAQQVQQVWPNLVSTTSPTALTPDGTLSLNFNGLFGPIVAAVQALDQQLTALENTVAGFAESVTTQVLNASQGNFSNELCVGSTCVTPAQFQAMAAAANVSQSSGEGSGGAASDDAQATDSPPVIQVNGDNPAIIQVGATYNDLGATITGPQGDLNLGIQTFVNGAAMSPVQIDTSEAATDTIDYVATDQNDLTSTSTRTVIVEAPSIVPTDDASSTDATSTDDATTTAQ